MHPFASVSNVLLGRLNKSTLLMYVFLFSLSILAGYLVATFNTGFLSVDFSPSDTKKTVFLIGSFLLLGLLAMVFKDGVKAFVLFFPLLISMNFVMSSVGITYDQLSANNILSYRPWIYLYEPLFFVGFVFVVFKIRKAPKWISAPVKFYFLLLFFASLSILLAINPLYGFIGLFYLVKYLLWVMLFLIIFSINVSYVSMAAWGFVLFVLAQSFVAILQAFRIQALGNLMDFTPDDLVTRYGVMRVAGTLGRSDLESSLMIILPILYSFSMSRTLSSLYRNFVLVSAVLGTLTLFLTGTRGPILSFALGITTMYLISLRVGRTKNKLPTVIIIISICIIGSLIFFAAGDVNDTLYRTTYVDRLLGVQWAVSMFLSSLVFGVGINNYLLALPHFGGVAAIRLLEFGRTVHNQYAVFLAETGFLGFAAFFLFLNSLFRTTWKAIINQSKLGGLTWFPIGFYGSLAAFSVSCLADVPLFKTPVQIILAMMTASICLLAYRND